jgi:CubicO group peptidase (beta-lactamase class C family)
VDEAGRSREVDALFAPWAARAGPGVGVLVVQRGRVVHAAGYGMADVASGRPITPRTPVELASLSKQITGMAVVHLARQGGLQYRDSVAAYLPAFRARYPGVQVRDLLNHTGGFYDYIAWFRSRGAAYDAFPRTERGADALHEPTMAEMLDSLAAQPPRFPPGVGWAYDNTGYLLAAAVVEKASGVTFAEYVRNNLFRPAGMAASSFVDPYGQGPRDLAHSYTCGRGGWQLLDYTPLERQMGAVGVVSTLEDLGRWYAALDASTLVPPELQQEAFTTGYLQGGQPIDYGFGWVLGNTMGMERQAHGGWWKGFRNISLRFPQPGITVVLLSNDAGFSPLRNEMAYRTARIYLRDGLRVPAAAALAADSLARLAGTYAGGGPRGYPVRVEAGALVVTVPSGTERRLIPTADGEFFVDGIEEERFRFVADPDGSTRLIRMEFGLGGTVRSWTVARRR